MPEPAKNAGEEEEVVTDTRLIFLSQYLLKTFGVKEEKWEKFILVADNKVLVIKLFEKSGLDKLFFTLGTGGSISVSADFPRSFKSIVKAVYFLRNNMEDLMLNNAKSREIKQSFTYGEFNGNCLQELPVFVEKIALNLLTNERNNEKWSTSTINDMSRNLENLKHNLRVFLGKSRNEVVLPLPDNVEHSKKLPESKEAIQSDILMRRMIYNFETIIIEWSHQIDKHLSVSSSDILLEDPSALPYQELDFWKRRQTTLKSIFDQLNQPKVRKMVEVLERIDSVYYYTFKKLFTDVVRDVMEADDITLKLEPLRANFEQFQQQEFNESQRYIEPIFHMIGLLWANCKYYRVASRIIVLLQETVNLFMEQCQVYLVPEEIFKIEAEDALVKLKITMKICQMIKIKYQQCKTEKIPEMLKKFKVEQSDETLWQFEPEMVFAKYDAMLRNITQIRRILETFQTFTKLEKVEFAGLRGTILSQEIQDISKRYNEAYKVFSECSYNLLDPLNEEFQQDYNRFYEEIEGLQKELKTIYLYGVEDCNNLENGIKVGLSLKECPIDLVQLLTIYQAINDNVDVNDSIQRSYVVILLYTLIYYLVRTIKSNKTDNFCLLNQQIFQFRFSNI